MMRKLRHVPIFLLLLPVPALAASLSGLVRDAAGEPIPRAHVSIYAHDRQERITAVTDDQGQYRVDALAPGEYLIEAEAPGMARSGARPLTLAASNTAATLDLA